MKAVNNRLPPKAIRLDSDEKYTRLFSTKNGNAISLRSGCVVLKENESIGEHNTDESEEILIILEGKGEFYVKPPLPTGERVSVRGAQRDGYKRLVFEKDMAIYIPPNTIHDVRNVGRDPLKYVFVTSQISSALRSNE